MSTHFRRSFDQTRFDRPRRIPTSLDFVARNRVPAFSDEWGKIDSSSSYRQLNRRLVAPQSEWAEASTDFSLYIRQAQHLLMLKEDWDGEGSPAPTRALVERVCEFLISGANWSWKRFGYLLPAPAVMPGPAESIDVQWKTPKARLLLNFPKDVSVPITFYGEDKTGNSTKHRICTEADNSLFVWLMERL